MLSKSQLSFIKSLHQKKYRVQHNLYLAEGLKICTELVASDFSIHSIYCTESVYPLLRQLTNSAGKNIEISTVSLSELEKISLLSSAQEVIALVHRDRAPAGSLQYPVIVADNVQDPGNLGTLIRIADWFGFPTVITSAETVEWTNPKVIQATMGSFLRVRVEPWHLPDFFAGNKAVVYGALLEGKSIYEIKFKADGVLVLGNESRGISPELMHFIDEPVTIPRTGLAESLNVAIAGAVICSEIRRTNISGLI